MPAPLTEYAVWKKRIIADIRQGSRRLVLSESFLVDSQKPADIQIPIARLPVTDEPLFVLKMNLVFRESGQGLSMGAYTDGEGTLNIYVDDLTRSETSTSAAVNMIIQSKPFHVLLFFQRAVTGTTVSVTLSIYDG